MHKGWLFSAEPFICGHLYFFFQVKELKEVRWHFIGHLQTNKCNNLAGKDLYILSVGICMSF